MKEEYNMKRDIEKGTLDGKITYCPMFMALECPYFGTNWVCRVDNPFEDCIIWDDFWPSYDEWKKS